MTPPPAWFPEKDDPKQSDTETRALQKLLGLTASSLGENGGFVIDPVASFNADFELDIVDPGEDSDLAISHVGRSFTVTLAYANSAVTTTYAELKALLLADVTLCRLVTTAEGDDYDGATLVSDGTWTPTAGVVTVTESGDDMLTLTRNATWTAPIATWAEPTTIPARAVVALADAKIDILLSDEWGGHAVEGITLDAGKSITIGLAAVTWVSGTVAIYF